MVHHLTKRIGMITYSRNTHPKDDVHVVFIASLIAEPAVGHIFASVVSASPNEIVVKYAHPPPFCPMS